MFGEPDDERLRQVRPPYVAFKAFDDFLSRAAREEVPARIDAALLARWQIAPGNESALITSLKSLGLIVADGRPTEDYRDVQLSPPRRQTALRRCAKRAYPGLDTAIGATIDADQLYDYFVAQRGLLGQMVEKASRFYRRFVEMLGVDSGPASGSPARQPSGHGAHPRGAGLTRGDAAEGPLLNVTVQIPSGASEAELIELFERIQRAWRKANAGRGTQFQ